MSTPTRHHQQHGHGDNGLECILTNCHCFLYHRLLFVSWHLEPVLSTFRFSKRKKLSFWILAGVALGFLYLQHFKVADDIKCVFGSSKGNIKPISIRQETNVGPCVLLFIFGDFRTNTRDDDHVAFRALRKQIRFNEVRKNCLLERVNIKIWREESFLASISRRKAELLLLLLLVDVLDNFFFCWESPLAFHTLLLVRVRALGQHHKTLMTPQSFHRFL